MINVWVYALGTEAVEIRNKRALGEWVSRAIQELQATLKDRAQVSEWIPFRSEHRHRNDESYVVLLVPPSRCLGVRDYFIGANALALEKSGRARVLPVISNLEGENMPGLSPVENESALVHRIRRLRDSLSRMALYSSIPEEEPALCGELLGRLNAEMAESTQRKPGRRQQKVSLFFSYSHQDVLLRDELARHLELLGLTGLLDAWHDKQIMAGDDWASEIDSHLCTSDVILLLLSADFFASHYCNEVEMPFARERHIAQSARVIPVLLKPSIWSGSWLYDLQALLVGALPVTAWPSTDSALVSVCEGVLGAALASRAEAAQHERKPTPEFSTRKREVDTAMPREVQIGRSAMLIVLIRKTSSEGLRGLLVEEASYGVEPEDVHSHTAAIRFPFRSLKLQGVDLTAVVRSPEFDPPEQQRRIHLAPDGDSQPVILLLAAKRQGQLRAVVDIYDGETLLVSCPMSTMAVEGRVSGTMAALGSAAIRVEETEMVDPAARHIDYEPAVVLSYPSFPKGTSPLVIREFMLRQDLGMNEKRMRPGHWKVSTSMRNLATFLRDIGRIEEAEVLYRRALASQEEEQGSSSIQWTLDELTELLRATNQLEEAEVLMRRSLSIEEKKWGPESWGMGAVWQKLAKLLLEMGKEPEAEVAQLRAIMIIAKGSSATFHDYLERLVREYAEMLYARGVTGQALRAALLAAAPELAKYGPTP